MGVLKYKNSQGAWEEVTDINQIITIEVEKPVIGGTWKAIRATTDVGFRQQPGLDNMVEFDLSAAGINMNEFKHWVLVIHLGYYQTDEYGTIFLSPIFDELNGKTKDLGRGMYQRNYNYVDAAAATMKSFMVPYGTLSDYYYDDCFGEFTDDGKFRYGYSGTTDDARDICETVTLFYLDVKED